MKSYYLHFHNEFVESGCTILINNYSLIPWPARKEVEGQQKKDVRNVSNSL